MESKRARHHKHEAHQASPRKARNTAHPPLKYLRLGGKLPFKNTTAKDNRRNCASASVSKMKNHHTHTQKTSGMLKKNLWQKIELCVHWVSSFCYHFQNSKSALSGCGIVEYNSVFNEKLISFFMLSSFGLVQTGKMKNSKFMLPTL